MCLGCQLRDAARSLENSMTRWVNVNFSSPLHF
jgi:hypothetical protein